MGMGKRRALGMRLVAALLAAGTGSALVPASSVDWRAAAASVPAPYEGKRGAAIEHYAAYDGQTTCNTTPRPGAVGLARWLTTRFPGTGTGRIVIPCTGSGVSEHKEGRAVDWIVCACNERQKDQAKAAIRLLLKTDAWGNRHARARRLGVMYIIWNRRMWRAYRPWDGWQPYDGDPHADHMHISLARKGGQARTSFWTGEVAQLPAAYVPDGAWK